MSSQECCSCSNSQSSQDPSILSPVWANLVVAILLFIERCVSYLVQFLIKRGMTMCVCESCCGLFGAKIKTKESERADPSPPDDVDFEDLEQEPPADVTSEA